MTHRTDIDGLRALAVIPVVLFHMDLAAFGGGFTGVDVFFVISGFLITSIIAHEIESPGSPGRSPVGGHVQGSGRFSLARFYERRVRRIFPALFTVLLVTTVLALLILLPRDYEAFAKSLVATSGFASNIYFNRQFGYFDAEAHTKPLLHTWSLAVEEQFYLVFPVLMLVLFRWLKARERVRTVLLALAAASFALAAWQVLAGPAARAAAFYLAPARAWELLLGSLLALGAVPAFRRQWMAESAAVAGVALLATGFLAFSLATPFPGPAALVPCLGAALLIHSGASASTVVSRVLSWRPLVFVGLISYSLYLWHWSLLSLARHWTLDPLTLGQTTAVVLVSVLASCASWRWIEQPIRGLGKRPATGPEPIALDPGIAPEPAPVFAASSLSSARPRTSRRAVFAWGGVVSALAIVAGLAGALSGGWPSRIDPAVIALDAAQNDFNTDRPTCHGGDGVEIPYRDTCRFGAPAAVPRYAVWGDSHAAELSLALGEYAARSGEAVRMVSYSRCPPALPVPEAARNAKCLAHNRATLGAVRGDSAIHTVFLIARYSQARDDMGDGYFEELGGVARALADAGKSVVLIYPSPEYAWPVPIHLARAAHRGEPLEDLGVPRVTFEARRAPFTSALDRIRADARIGKVDPARRLCDEERCHIYAEGKPLYFDDDHLSVAGARYVAPLFAKYFGSRVIPLGDASAEVIASRAH
jgi:peptidoglycan/LPS O-acetylase OafA/YrhL